MLQPSKTLLIANSIVATNNTQIPRCWLCDEESSSSKNWLDHILMRDHSLRSKHFEASAFVNQGSSGFYCDLCSQNYDWSCLVSHAKDHKIAPWYRPVDLYKIFFDNRILASSKNFYCYACDNVFRDWSLALRHVDESRHVEELKAKTRMRKKQRSLDLTGTNIVHEWLVYNGMYTHDKGGNFCCKICNRYDIAIKCFDEHVVDLRHRNKKFGLIEGLRVRADREIFEERMSENRILLEDQERGNSYWCDYCKCRVGGLERLTIHLEGQKHRIARWDPKDNGEVSGMEDASIRSGKEPIRSDNEPIRSDNEPIRSGNEPIRSGNEPIRSGNDPIRSDNEPIRSGNKPIRSRNEPIRSRNEPIRSRNEPIRSCNEPIRSGNEPIRSDNEKIRSGNKPIRSHNEPIRSRNEPIRSRNEPIKSRNEPIRSNNRPFRSGNESIGSENQPIKNENPPIRSCNEPIRREKQPIRSNKEPIRSGKEPFKKGQEPTRSGNELIRSRNEQIRSSNGSFRSDNESIRSDSEPMRGGKEPFRREKQPIKMNKEPIMSGNEPIRSNNRPLRSGNETIRSGNQPINNENPPRSNNEPIRRVKQPIRSVKERIKSGKEAIRSDKKPIKMNKEPIRSENEPIRSRNEQIRSYNEPIRSENQPIRIENQPTKINNQPIEIENEPIEMNKEPISSEKQPTKIENEPIKSENVQIRIENEPIRSVIPQNPSDGANSPQIIILPDYMSLKNIAFHCTICNSTLYNEILIQPHVTNIRHIKRKKELSDNKLTHRGYDNWHCDYCDCSISNYIELMKHINEDSHRCRKNDPKMINNVEENPSNKDFGRHNDDQPITVEIAKMPLDGADFNGDRSKSENLTISNVNQPIASSTTKQPIDGAIYDEIFLMSNDYIVKYNKTAYKCQICLCNIDNNDDMRYHLSSKRHIDQREKFHVNKITYKGKGRWNCDICGCNIRGLDTISQHIHRIKHIRKAQLKRENLSNVGKSNDAIATTKKNVQEKLNDYISWSNDELNGCCKICNTTMMNCNDIVIHCEKPGHIINAKKLTRNKILYEKNDVYRCEYCNCQIFDINSAKEHIKQDEHRRLKNHKSKNEKIPNSKISDQFSNDTINVLSQNFNNEYIVKINSTNSVCKICNFIINEDKQGIDEHLIGIDHAETLKKYNCENIILVDSVKRHYYCKSCDSTIKCDGEIWRHAIGIKHSKSLITTSIIVKKNLQKKTDKDATKPNVKISFSNKLWDRKISDLEIKVRCKICKIILSNVVKYHSHLAGHFSNDFLDSEDNDEESGKKNENLTIIDSLNVIDDIPDDDDSSISSKMTEDRTKIPRKIADKSKLKGKVPKIERIRKIVNFDNNIIYKMSEKFRIFEIGWMMSYEKCCKKIYCLVCRIVTNFTRKNYHEHLFNLEHCINHERMERDCKLFLEFPKQYSDIDLGLQYMEEISFDHVQCHVCEMKISSSDDSLRSHMTASSHARNWQSMRDLTMKNFDEIKITLSCDWYKIKTYRCVPCLLTFNSEVNFSEHMNGKNHLEIMEKPVNKKWQLIYDFCEACALLWYGYRRTCAYHCTNDTHLWLLRDGYYLSEKLPKNVIELLGITENYVRETIRFNDASIDEESSKEILLIRDLEISVGQKYPDAKAHIFGSRVTRVGSSNCDIDIFLDCGDMYNGKIKSNDLILKFMDNVAECLNKLPETWIVEEIIKTCRSPIIKIHHSPTGLSCDISFQNGLGVEKTYLIKSYIDAFPLCREMIIFLKRWMTLCDLSERITSFAIYWHVIFYLQQEKILPSIEQLIKFKNQSRTVDGWEVGAARDFDANLANDNFSIIQLLTSFFDYWCKFEQRYYVACPMIGRVLKKRDFLGKMKINDSTSLRYEEHVKKSMERGPLRIDSAMCLQDPLDLRYNITQSLSKVYVNRFRKYCSLSHDILAGS